MKMPAMVKHSVRIAGHATSVSLEAAFWSAFLEIAARRGVSINTLLAAIDAERGGNLSSAVRLFVLESCRRGELRDDAPRPSGSGVASPGRATHSAVRQASLRQEEGG
jgi:predicted DNA-binding ribbon-helix-helix protein